MDADASHAVFASAASDLVPADTNGHVDVFLWERSGNSITLVSRAPDGGPADGMSRPADITPDGRYVVFTSTATNLVADDTNAQQDVFIYDRSTGEIALVSSPPGGGPANGDSFGPSIDSEANAVAYSSMATNLADGDSAAHRDIFVWNRAAAASTLVSHAFDDGPANGHSGAPTISADGRYVTFDSSASNLHADDANDFSDVFQHDLRSGHTALVSRAADGGPADGPSRAPASSADGRYVAFGTLASDIDPSYSSPQVLVWDRLDGRTSWMGDGYRPSMSASGTRVGFVIRRVGYPQRVQRTDWAPGFTVTSEVCQRANGTLARRDCGAPQSSDDGEFLAYHSASNNLARHDHNRRIDAFVWHCDGYQGCD